MGGNWSLWVQTFSWWKLCNMLAQVQNCTHLPNPANAQQNQQTRVYVDSSSILAACCCSYCTSCTPELTQCQVCAKRTWCALMFFPFFRENMEKRMKSQAASSRKSMISIDRMCALVDCSVSRMSWLLSDGLEFWPSSLSDEPSLLARSRSCIVTTLMGHIRYHTECQKLLLYTTI